MKTKFLITLLVLALFSFGFECQEDPNDVTDKRENIDGKWHAILNDGAVDQDYEIEITKDLNNTAKINISNFINNGSSVSATMTSLNLTVAETTVGNSTVSGEGTISSDYQSITWTLTIDGDPYTMEFTPGGITKSEPAK